MFTITLLHIEITSQSQKKIQRIYTNLENPNHMAEHPVSHRRNQGTSAKFLELNQASATHNNLCDTMKQS